MLTGQLVNVKIAHRNYPVLRPGYLIAVSQDRALVLMRSPRGKIFNREHTIDLADVWICHDCGGPGEMRFRKKCWCQECFDRVECADVPDRIENHLRTCSPLARAEEVIPPPPQGIGQWRKNRQLAKRMKKIGIPTMDPRARRTKGVAP
jgi:hypothetical protein